MTNKVTAELLQAYTETDYIVHHAPPFTLKIDEPSPALLQLFDKTNAVCTAFITAFNPFNESLPEYKNKELQAQLGRYAHFQGHPRLNVL